MIKNKSGSYCPQCKHIAYCDWGKMLSNTFSNLSCTDYEDSVKHKLRILITKLDDKQVEYIYTFVRGVFGE